MFRDTHKQHLNEPQHEVKLMGGKVRLTCCGLIEIDDKFQSKLGRSWQFESI